MCCPEIVAFLKRQIDEENDVVKRPLMTSNFGCSVSFTRAILSQWLKTYQIWCQNMLGFNFHGIAHDYIKIHIENMYFIDS